MRQSGQKNDCGEGRCPAFCCMELELRTVLFFLLQWRRKSMAMPDFSGLVFTARMTGIVRIFGDASLSGAAGICHG
jgi:hypothetical protein